MDVDLSPSGRLLATPPSSLTAKKTSFNGGTYTSVLYVKPRFSFTKVGVGTQREFDTFDAGVDAIELSHTHPMP